MHGQQPGGLVHGEPSIWSGVHMKMGYSSTLLIEKENIAGKRRAGTAQMLWMFTSADNLHVHPLRMQPRDGIEAFSFSNLRPSTRHIPQMEKTARQEARKRAARMSFLAY